GRDDEFRASAEDAPPLEPELETLRREERTIAGRDAVDGEVVEDDRAAQDVNRQPPDVDGPLQLLGSAALAELAHRRPEIDRQRRDDRGRQDRDRQLDRALAEAKREVR